MHQDKELTQIQIVDHIYVSQISTQDSWLSYSVYFILPL